MISWLFFLPKKRNKKSWPSFEIEAEQTNKPKKRERMKGKNEEDEEKQIIMKRSTADNKMYII